MAKASPRRAFLKSLTAAPLLPAAFTTTQTAPSPVASPSPSPSPDPNEPLAQALTEVARRRYGKYWEGDDAEEVRKGIQDGLRAADRLRTVKLTNADEPVTAFAARPPRAAAPPAAARPRTTRPRS
jgi:hypothetical protein